MDDKENSLSEIP